MSFNDPHHDHAACARSVIARAEEHCARSHTRLTPQRREVLEHLAQSHMAVGAYEIIERMADAGSARPAPITIYRALDFLLKNGLAHKIESRNAYVACTGGHGDGDAAIFVCDVCGTVAEFNAPHLFHTLEVAAAASQFSPRRMVLEVAGLCAPCQAAAPRVACETNPLANPAEFP